MRIRTKALPQRRHTLYCMLCMTVNEPSYYWGLPLMCFMLGWVLWRACRDTLGVHCLLFLCPLVTMFSRFSVIAQRGVLPPQSVITTTVKGDRKVSHGWTPRDQIWNRSYAVLSVARGLADTAASLSLPLILLQIWVWFPKWIRQYC